MDIPNNIEPPVAATVPPGVTIVNPTPPAPIVQPQMVQPQMVAAPITPAQVAMPVQESFFNKVDWLQFAVMTTIIALGIFSINYFSTKKKVMDKDIKAVSSRVDEVESNLQSLVNPEEQQ